MHLFESWLLRLKFARGRTKCLIESVIWGLFAFVKIGVWFFNVMHYDLAMSSLAAYLAAFPGPDVYFSVVIHLVASPLRGCCLLPIGFMQGY